MDQTWILYSKEDVKKQSPPCQMTGEIGVLRRPKHDRAFEYQ